MNVSSVENTTLIPVPSKKKKNEIETTNLNVPWQQSQKMPPSSTWHAKCEIPPHTEQ